MDIQKLVEMELKKMLKEDEPTAAAPKEVIFKNKNADAAKCVKLGAPLPNSIGLICDKSSRKPEDPKAFSASLLEGFSWVAPKDENDYSVKTSDPALIKKYTYIQQVRIAQQIENAISKIKSIPTSKIKRVGDIQGAVELLRKYFPLVGSKVPFPSKQNYRDLTTRLQAILTVILKNPNTVKKAYEQAQSEIAKEKETPTQPATATTAQPVAPEKAVQPGPKVGASTGEVLGGRGTSQEDPLRFATSQSAETFFQRQAEKTTDKNFERNVYAQTANGQKFIVSILGGKAEMRPLEPLEESKLIRKMIVQEVRKALKK
jgi:hypothetical protein